MKNKKRLLSQSLLHVVSLVLLIIILFPLLWMVSSSLKTPKELFSNQYNCWIFNCIRKIRFCSVASQQYCHYLRHLYPAGIHFPYGCLCTQLLQDQMEPHHVLLCADHHGNPFSGYHDPQLYSDQQYGPGRYTDCRDSMRPLSFSYISRCAAFRSPTMKSPV